MKSVEIYEKVGRAGFVGVGALAANPHLVFWELRGHNTERSSAA